MNTPERDFVPAELSLEESTEELYELAPCGYLITTASGRMVRVNQTFTDWIGYDRAELLSGRRFTDLLTTGGRIFYETHLSLLLRVENSLNEIALDLVTRDGRILPVLINARQKRDANNQPLLNRFTIFNASERRMYERQLLVARDLFETTLASMGDGVISTDAAGNVMFLNAVAAELSGWDQETAAARPVEEVLVLVREDSGEPVENPVRNALRTGGIVGLENHTLLLSKNGRTLVVDDSASPIRDANGAIIGAVLVFRDISDRRRSERALSEAYKQLEQTAAELRRSNEDLSQFACVASHDLRSPLKTVTNFIQLLERRYGTQLGEGKELLRHITEATQRMANLIEDLLRFSTISSSREFSTALIDSNASLELAIENLQSAITESGAVVTHSPLPLIGIDQTSLIQIFQNLIGNAIRYRSEQKPEIHVSAEQRNGAWLFACSDNGIGIAPEYHSRIFEPFKRLHGAKIPGSGIGLAVCRKIVQRYGGDIWVESSPGQGSTFYFTLPSPASNPMEIRSKMPSL